MDPDVEGVVRDVPVAVGQPQRDEVPPAIARIRVGAERGFDRRPDPEQAVAVGEPLDLLRRQGPVLGSFEQITALRGPQCV